jgi:KDO2-lipid IV(A) lauroyltransferase
MPKRTKKPRNDFIDWLQYIALRLISMMLHSFPVEVNLRTAQFLGTLLYHADKKHRDRALSNLHRSFPEMTQKQCERLARRSQQDLVKLAVEVLFTTRLIRIDTWAKYIDLNNFREVVGLLLRKDQGLIMLTGHYGNWEILGYLLATLGFNTTSVARPLDNPYVNEWLLGVRERQGQRIVAKTGATDEVIDVLSKNGTVCFIADQNAGSKGIFVDFFGRKASTYKSIGLIAMQYKVPVVIGYARRDRERFRFTVGVQDIIYAKDWDDQPDPLRYITQRYTKAIEEMVCAEPSQYLWVHRRWKTRPKGEAAETYD